MRDITIRDISILELLERIKVLLIKKPHDYFLCHLAVEVLHVEFAITSNTYTPNRLAEYIVHRNLVTKKIKEKYPEFIDWIIFIGKKYFNKDNTQFIKFNFGNAWYTPSHENSIEFRLNRLNELIDNIKKNRGIL